MKTPKPKTHLVTSDWPIVEFSNSSIVAHDSICGKIIAPARFVFMWDDIVVGGASNAISEAIMNVTGLCQKCVAASPENTKRYIYGIRQGDK